MEAFVLRTPGEKLSRLFRFALSTDDGTIRHFYTAFEPEAKEVASRETSRAVRMRAYVFSHDFTPTEAQAKDIIPVYCFYNAESGEHFYTTSETEKEGLVRREQPGASIAPQ